MMPSTAVASLAEPPARLAGSTDGACALGERTAGRRHAPTALARADDEVLGRAGRNGTGYGLGLAHQTVDDREVWGHVGDIPGFHAELWHLPAEDLTMTVAWNDDRISNDVIPRSLLIVALDAVK